MKKVTDEFKDIGLKNALSSKLYDEFYKAKEDPVFKKLITKIKLPEAELIKYTSSFEDSKEEYKNCLNCKSLHDCKNKITGYAYMPIYKNDNLEFNYLECRYKKKFKEENDYLENVSLYDVPKEIRNAQMKDVFGQYKERHATIKWLHEFIEKYDKNTPMKGLFLHGNFGSGKTFLIAATFNELAKKGVKSSIIYWPEFLRDLKSSFGNNSEFKNKFEKVQKSPILLIDDIGAENTTEWGRDEIFGPIVQYRMQEGLPTFFTSNLDIDSLEQHFSVTKDKISSIKATRIIERIKQLTDNIEIISKNLRK